jgi:hypothetical protein
MGSRLAVPYSPKLMLFTRVSTAYKKQGAPEWRSLFTIYYLNEKLADPDWRIIVLPVCSYQQRTESKGHLYIYVHPGIWQ